MMIFKIFLLAAFCAVTATVAQAQGTPSGLPICYDTVRGFYYTCPTAPGTVTVTTQVTVTPGASVSRVTTTTQSSSGNITFRRDDTPRAYYSERPPYYVSDTAGYPAYVFEPEVHRETRRTSRVTINGGMNGRRPWVVVGGTWGRDEYVIHSTRGARFDPRYHRNPDWDYEYEGTVIGPYGEYQVFRLRRPSWRRY